MPTTMLQPTFNRSRPYVPNPKWLIVIDQRKVVRDEDLNTLREFARRTVAGTQISLEGQKLTNAVSSILADAEKQLASGSDIYVLDNGKGNELHFIRPSLSYQARVGYIRGVERERANDG